MFSLLRFTAVLPVILCSTSLDWRSDWSLAANPSGYKNWKFVPTVFDEGKGCLTSATEKYVEEDCPPGGDFRDCNALDRTPRPFHWSKGWRDCCVSTPDESRVLFNNGRPLDPQFNRKGICYVTDLLDDTSDPGWTGWTDPSFSNYAKARVAWKSRHTNDVGLVSDETTTATYSWPCPNEDGAVYICYTDGRRTPVTLKGKQVSPPLVVKKRSMNSTHTPAPVFENPHATGFNGTTQVGVGVHTDLGHYSLHRKVDPVTGEVTFHKVFEPQANDGEISTEAPPVSSTSPTVSTPGADTTIVGKFIICHE